MVWQEVCVLGIFAVCFKLHDLYVIFGEGPLAALELYNSLENLLPFSRHPDGINYVKGTGKYLAFEQYLVMCIYL